MYNTCTTTLETFSLPKNFTVKCFCCVQRQINLTVSLTRRILYNTNSFMFKLSPPCSPANMSPAPSQFEDPWLSFDQTSLPPSPKHSSSLHLKLTPHDTVADKCATNAQPVAPASETHKTSPNESTILRGYKLAIVFVAMLASWSTISNTVFLSCGTAYSLSLFSRSGSDHLRCVWLPIRWLQSDQFHYSHCSS